MKKETSTGHGGSLSAGGAAQNSGSLPPLSDRVYKKADADLRADKPDSLAFSVKDAVSYFREHAVLGRLLDGFREKYLSYGRFGGSIVLEDLSAEDIEALEGFFQTGFHGRKQVRVTAVKFQKALAFSRFSELSPETLLKAYTGEPLRGKKELEEERKNRMETVFDQAEEFWKNTLAESWVRNLRRDPAVRNRYFQKSRPFSDRYRNLLSEKKPWTATADTVDWKGDQKKPVLDRNIERWIRQYDFLENQSEEEISAVCTLILGGTVIEAFPCREQKYEFLPVFAARISGDPHYFDQGTAGGNLLYQLAQWMTKDSEEEAVRSRIFFSLSRQRICLKTGILQGDSSNYAMLYGVGARRKDGKAHRGMDGFLQEQEMVQIPLHVIEGWASVSCPDHRIWVVENPSVYSFLCSQSEGRYACMCMNGQPRLSSLRVLDLLAVSGVSVYYAGDFDPEGLLIAQKLKQYYAGEFHYWHMGAEDCRAAMSGVNLSETRLKSLSKISDPLLRPAADVILKTGCAGYQENIWERYLSDPLRREGLHL